MKRLGFAAFALAASLVVVGCAKEEAAEEPAVAKPSAPAPDNGQGATPTPSSGQGEMLPPPPKIGG